MQKIKKTVGCFSIMWHLYNIDSFQDSWSFSTGGWKHCESQRQWIISRIKTLVNVTWHIWIIMVMTAYVGSAQFQTWKKSQHKRRRWGTHLTLFKTDEIEWVMLVQSCDVGRSSSNSGSHIKSVCLPKIRFNIQRKKEQEVMWVMT